MSQRVMVFGGTGFIGSHVVEAYVNAGYAVSVVVRDTANCEFLDRLPVQKMVVAHYSIEALYALIPEHSIVVNCTADVRPHQTLEVYRTTQVGLTKTLLEAAHKAKALRFIQLSTVEVYGKQPATPIDENFPPKPLYPFQQACLEREQVVSTYCQQVGMEFVLIRPASTFGKRNMYSDMLVKNHAHGVFQFIGNGRNRLSAIDTRDVGRAFVFLSQLPQARNQIFLVKGYDTCMNDIAAVFDQVSSRTSKRQALPTFLAYLIATVLELVTPRGKMPMFTRFIVHAITTTKLYDDAKIRRLGFSPKFTLEDNVRVLLEAPVK